MTAEPEHQGERLVESSQKVVERNSNRSPCNSRDGGATSDGGGSDTALYPINMQDQPKSTPSEGITRPDKVVIKQVNEEAKH